MVGEEAADLSHILTNKDLIKIEKQGSIDGGRLHHNNLKSRKSQKVQKQKQEPVVLSKGYEG